MSVTTELGAILTGLLRWLAKYLAWLLLAVTITLGGASILRRMLLLKDGKFKSVLLSLLSTPMRGLGARAG